jgi:acyl-coenzyme A synthetase/AMP-(fatty) acid ligase
VGSKKSDTLSVYTPTTEYAVATFLAFAPIGVVHSVDFAGFSSESLRDHITDCKSRALITTVEDRRVERLLGPRLSLMPLSSMVCPEEDRKHCFLDQGSRQAVA